MGSVGQQWQKYTYDDKIGFCTTLEDRPPIKTIATRASGGRMQKCECWSLSLFTRFYENEVT